MPVWTDTLIAFQKNIAAAPILRDSGLRRICPILRGPLFFLFGVDMGKIPAFQFYPADWLKDPGVQAATSATRGAWINLLCRMWESENRGTIEGTSDQIRKLAGCEPGEWMEIYKELVTLKIANVTEANKIITLKNRRMSRDHNRNKLNKMRQERFREKRKSNAEITPLSSSSSSKDKR